jgi:predicted alpha/beta-fold hydrolase
MGTPANCGTEQTGHITYVGAERLAKAMWWMLARIAGWDGN